MPPDELSGPDLAGVVADANAVGLGHVVIGGFSVIFHGLEDVAGADSLRVNSRHGIIDIMRGGLPPLDYDTVARRADTTEWDGQMIRIAALPSIVGFKRLAGRPQDRVDLTELKAIYGELPIEPIPSLDT